MFGCSMKGSTFPLNFPVEKRNHWAELWDAEEALAFGYGLTLQSFSSRIEQERREGLFNRNQKYIAGLVETFGKEEILLIQGWGI